MFASWENAWNMGKIQYCWRMWESLKSATFWLKFKAGESYFCKCSLSDTTAIYIGKCSLKENLRENLKRRQYLYEIKIWSLYYFVAIFLHIKCSISDQNVEYTFSLKISFLFNLIPWCLRQIWGMNICNDWIVIWSIIHWIFQREFLLKKPGLKLHNLWKEWIYYSIKTSLWVCFLLHRLW